MTQKDHILSAIRNPNDVKGLNPQQLGVLAQELRDKILATVSRNGGHLASNLGSVELTLALCLSLDLSRDRLIFDVGHQSYAYKLLTGRAAAFDTLRRLEGVSGFPRRTESSWDHFGTGHASTAASAALGMARARDLRGTQETVVAVVGDGALTGGMTYEALNDAGQSKIPLIIVLNDNGMSIHPNVGALNNLLNRLRSSPRYQVLKRRAARNLSGAKAGKSLRRFLEGIKTRVKFFLLPNVFFESLGFTYLGPVNGHDVPALVRVLDRARQMQRPVIVHALTQKGRGYGHAEARPGPFHGVTPFDLATGTCETPGCKSNSLAFGEELVRLAGQDGRIVAVSAAMVEGTGLTPMFQAYPRRCFDVGIAEGHAVTMAAGMAAGGLRPVVALYSTFLQRAYDQIIHDVCLQNLPVVFAIDRAGLVGEDGDTHQGVYDISFLYGVNNMIILSPATQAELAQMLAWALNQDSPAAIRYGRGALPQGQPHAGDLLAWREELPLGAATLICSGRLMETARQVAEELNLGLIQAPCLKPLDTAMLERLRGTRLCLTLEDGITAGGFGTAVSAHLSSMGVACTCFGADSAALGQGTIAQQDEASGISAQRLIARIRALL